MFGGLVGYSSVRVDSLTKIGRLEGARDLDAKARDRLLFTKKREK